MSRISPFRSCWNVRDNSVLNGIRLITSEFPVLILVSDKSISLHYVFAVLNASRHARGLPRRLHSLAVQFHLVLDHVLGPVTFPRTAASLSKSTGGIHVLGGGEERTLDS